MFFTLKLTSGHSVDVGATAELICSVYCAYKSSVFEHVQKRVLKEERLGSSTHWTELIHVAGRLMTYKQAIDVSFMVRKLWPELFQDFRITMVQSSASAPHVLNKKVMTIKEIIHKTTSDESILEELYAAAERTERLQSFRLDQEIKEEWSKKSKDGIHIHAEINLLRYLEQTEGGTEDSRFFQGIKFIGSSKPPCKLCSYFFQEYPTDVEVRASHRNLYGKWLMPDINSDQASSRGGSDTLKVARKIRDRLRNDLLQALRGGEIDGRPHDSSNYSTRRGPRSNTCWEEVSAHAEVSSVTYDSEADATGNHRLPSDREQPLSNSLITNYIQAQVSVNNQRRSIDPPALHSLLITTEDQPGCTLQISCPTRASLETDEDEDEEGGVLLFPGRANLRTGVRGS
jgi:hypothetical protein